MLAPIRGAQGFINWRVVSDYPDELPRQSQLATAQNAAAHAQAAAAVSAFTADLVERAAGRSLTINVIRDKSNTVKAHLESFELATGIEHSH